MFTGRESLPIAALLHIGVNNYFSTTWSEIFPGGDHATVTRITLIASTIAALVTIVATRGKLGYAPPRSAPHDQDAVPA